MWELDHKNSWVPKNWCFRTVVLEKTLESSLDSKEIKAINPKGNQPWIFIGRTDAEAETPILWLPDAKNRLVGKDPWTAVCQAPLSSTVSWSLFKLMSIESVMPSNHLIHCHSLFLPPSIFPSIRVFSNEWALCVRWPKFWSFSISSSNEYSGLISFRIDWFYLLVVQGTLKSLLQHHNSKTSIL